MQMSILSLQMTGTDWLWLMLPLKVLLSGLFLFMRPILLVRNALRQSEADSSGG